MCSSNNFYWIKSLIAINALMFCRSHMTIDILLYITIFSWWYHEQKIANDASTSILWWVWYFVYHSCVSYEFDTLCIIVMYLIMSDTLCILVMYLMMSDTLCILSQVWYFMYVYCVSYHEFDTLCILVVYLIMSLILCVS